MELLGKPKKEVYL